MSDKESDEDQDTRMYLRRMICQHGLAHMTSFMKSVALGQTEPPSIFTVDPESFFDLLREELSRYRSRLINPKRNPHNITY